MEQVLLEMAKQAPSLGLLIYVVIVFLKHVKDINAAHDEQLQRIAEAHGIQQREMMASHSKRTDEFIAAMKEIKGDDRTLMARIHEMLSTLNSEVTRLSERISNQHEQHRS